MTQTEPARPRAVNPRIPSDLETIVLTAIQREPSRRYATAGALADDLRRFAEGRPIQARRITAPERFWRWCRRNRALAASLATAALLLVAISVVMTVGYWQAAKLNTELAASLRRERQERENAEATSGLALDALQSVFDQFAPSQIPMASLVMGGEDDQNETVTISVQPAPSPQVAAALQSLLPFYHRLAERREQDTNVRLQAADAYHRIGLIQTQLGEFDAALAAYGQAIAQLEQLAPALLDRREDLSLAVARIQNDTGDLERLRSRYRESDEAYRSALRRLEQTGEASASREYRFELARSHISLAQRGRMLPGPRQALPRIRIRHRRGLSDEAERRAQRLPFTGPPGPPGFPAGSDVRPLRAPLEAPPGEVDRQRHLEAAISLLDELVEAHPEDPKFRLLLAKSYRERAAGPFGASPQKTADRANAVKLMQSLIEEFPSNPDYRFELSQTYAEIGFPALFAGQPGPESQLREALSISEDLVSRFPHNLAYAVAQVQIRVRLGIMLYHKDQTPEAIALLREALASQTALSDRFSGEGVYLIQLAMLTHLLADLLLEAGQTGEALQVLERAATRLTELDSHSPRPAFVAGALAGTFERWGELLHQQGEDERADEALLKSRQYWKELDTANVGPR